MTELIKVISVYKKGETYLSCRLVRLEDSAEAFEVMIEDTHIYTGRKHTFQRAPYWKVFKDKDSANRYAAAIIKKNGMKRVQ